MAGSPWLIVGLGNPGPEYAGNRHNFGFLVVETLAQRTGGRFKRHKTRADVVEGRVGSARAQFSAKPTCYMNESGGQVAALKNFFDVPLDQVVIVHDELDLDRGVVRLKVGGGDNGHNGLRSITKSLGSNEYVRVRVARTLRSAMTRAWLTVSVRAFRSMSDQRRPRTSPRRRP